MSEENNERAMNLEIAALGIGFYEKIGFKMGVNWQLKQAQAEIENLKDRMVIARKRILADLKASQSCECVADNGSNYTDIICYRHAALLELK